MTIITQVILPLMLLASPFFIVFILVNRTYPINVFYKSAVALALVTGFLLIWINLAVGIIGSEDNDANLGFLLLLLIGIFGAIKIKFQAIEMSYVMLTLAVSHVLILALELIIQTGSQGPIWPFDVIGATCIFVFLWFGSALLFRRAALDQFTPKK